MKQYTPPRGRAARPWWSIYNLLYFGQFAYTVRNGIHQPFSYFSRPQPGGGVYMVSPICWKCVGVYGKEVCGGLGLRI